jgi:hypothetical protein
MPVSQGVTTRALMDLTVGLLQTTRARDRRDRQMGLAELVQQFQFEFSGTAGTLWGFASKTLVFEFPFYYAPGQRDPDFEHPHYWFGAEVSPPVAVSGTVTHWVYDDKSGAVIGAAVAVGVCGAAAALAYEGTAHLTFQGMSALAEDEVDFQDIEDVG